MSAGAQVREGQVWRDPADGHRFRVREVLGEGAAAHADTDALDGGQGMRFPCADLAADFELLVDAFHGEEAAGCC